MNLIFLPSSEGEKTPTNLVDTRKPLPPIGGRGSLSP